MSECACLGVAGNFTGHLEQAGEDADFLSVRSDEAAAPKAVFPTYLPCGKTNGKTPEKTPGFLRTFPFDSEKIIFPRGEERVQIEAECAIVFGAEWSGDELLSLKPRAFCASNDVSIRKQGARKISEKKNWGASSKGAGNMIFFADASADNQDAWRTLERYRIASYLRRGGALYEYGENSAVKSYSYFYEKLVGWIVRKINLQKDEGPCEDIHSYLAECAAPQNIFVSVGATRYTDFGERNFLCAGDESVVCLYPEDRYSREEVEEIILGGEGIPGDISLLAQKVLL